MPSADIVNLEVHVGSVVLPSPVMTASGTAGHSDELAGYVDLGKIGAVVVKSLAAYEWAGNPAPRIRPVDAGMLNSVGLQGKGVERWVEEDLPGLRASGAHVVASIWGRSVDDYAEAAEMLKGVEGVSAVEVNISCPNVEDRSKMFAHSVSATSEALEASAKCGLPRWAKLSPNVADITEIADAASAAGAEAVVLTNTVMGMAIDIDSGSYALGSGPRGGGLSGPAIRPVVVRAVHDCRSAFPDLAIVGVGGIATGRHAVEMMMAGANAVEVGTATFAAPRAVAKVIKGLTRWCIEHHVGSVSDLTGKVHRRTALSEPHSRPAPEPNSRPGPQPAPDKRRKC